MNNLPNSPFTQEENVSWAPMPNEVSLVLSPQPDAPITAAQVFVLCSEGMLLTRVNSRGWDIPGGHVDEGEAPLEAALREVQEETGLILEHAEALGYARLEVFADKPEDYAYPYPTSAQQVFYAWVENPDALSENLTFECDEAKWIPIDKVRDLCKNRTWLPFLDHALNETGLGLE